MWQVKGVERYATCFTHCCKLAFLELIYSGIMKFHYSVVKRHIPSSVRTQSKNWFLFFAETRQV